MTVALSRRPGPHVTCLSCGHQWSGLTASDGHRWGEKCPKVSTGGHAPPVGGGAVSVDTGAAPPEHAGVSS